MRNILTINPIIYCFTEETNRLPQSCLLPMTEFYKFYTIKKPLFPVQKKETSHRTFNKRKIYSFFVRIHRFVHP